MSPGERWVLVAVCVYVSAGCDDWNPITFWLLRPLHVEARTPGQGVERDSWKDWAGCAAVASHAMWRTQSRLRAH